MSDLLCDHLGTLSNEEQRSLNARRRSISNILEWIKCFCIYMAVVSRKNPQKLPEMLAYVTLIIEAHMEYSGEAWLGYDRRFRQRAAADPSMSWAKIDPTLWSLAFSGRAKASRCRHCFNLTHASADCGWMPIPENGNQPLIPTTNRICFDWNKDPRPGCSRANCTYQHIKLIVPRILQWSTKFIRPSSVLTILHPGEEEQAGCSIQWDSKAKDPIGISQ